MSARTCLAIVLAAGEGTRMRATLPKVLHQIGNRTLLEHALRTAMQAGGSRLAVMVGPDQMAVADEVEADRAGCANFRTTRTARDCACRPGRACSAQHGQRRRPRDVCRYASHPGGNARALASGACRGGGGRVLGFALADPTGYGRLIMRGEELVAIREEKDASEAEKNDHALQRRR